MSKFFKMLLSISAVFVVLFAFTSLSYAEMNKPAKVTGDAVNLRTQPSTEAEVLAKIDKGTDVIIVGESEGWYNISFADKKGWMSVQFVSVVDAAANKGKILAENVNLRSGASLSASVLAKLAKGEDVTVAENSGEWIKVTTTANVTGWVHKDYVSSQYSNVSRGEEPVAAKKDDAADSNSSKAQELVEYAKTLLGVKYVYGGSTPKGFDCSGFTSYVYNHFGIKLQRVAANQAGQGTKVDKANLKAGDLVFFDTDGGKNYICHVGIYIGDGNFIHASSGRSTKRVVISNLSEGFYQKTYMTARRFLD